MEVAPEYRVRPEEMFFSLTDLRGVITGANSVFSRISGYSPDDLLGSPHSIVRSPVMPGGVFRLMWDTIQAGRPFAGYVQSAASGGTRYWVFATITPVAGGYLSVRTAPCIQETWHAAQTLYTKVAAAERQARDGGANCRAAAQLGREQILDGLNALGFRSYEDFMGYVLPAEAAERARLAPRSEEVMRTQNDPALEQVQGAARAISAEAQMLLSQIQHFRALGDGLRQSATAAADGAKNLALATSAARAASELVAVHAPAVLSTAQAMEAGGTSTLKGMGHLAQRLDVDHRLLRGLQIRMALAKLHADMVSSFVDDLAAGGESRLGIDYVPEVCAALTTTVRMLAEAMRAHTNAMTDAVSLTEQISGGLDRFQDFLFMWRNLLIRHGVSTEVADHLGPIDYQLHHGSAHAVALRELARQCLTAANNPYDAGPMLARLGQLTSASGVLAAV